MQPTMAMKVHTPSSYLARNWSRDSSAGVFGSIAQVNMYRPDPSKGLLTQNPCASRDQRPTRPGSGAPGGASSLRHFAEGRANSPFPSFMRRKPCWASASVDALFVVSLHEHHARASPSDQAMGSDYPICERGSPLW